MKIEVEDYQKIRWMYEREELSIRQIAKKTGISRNTVKKYCLGEKIPGESKSYSRAKTVMTEPVLKFIQQCLNDDLDAPKKQRHTSARIFNRLVKELDFAGSYPAVNRAVASIRGKRITDLSVPLDFDPGEAAQIDWGEATVIINKIRTKAMLFCMRLCYSSAIFVQAFPSQNQESLLEGHVNGFHFFGGVPERLIYDNMKTVVKDGWGANVRLLQDGFNVLKAHYCFGTDFCNPGKGNEKGLVENLVGFIRRNALVPIPEVESWDELNELLYNNCRDYFSHRIPKRTVTVGYQLEEEKPKLLALPKYRMDTSKLQQVKPDNYSTVGFSSNRYSVPVQLAGKVLTVKGYGYKVKIFYKGQMIAEHNRNYGKNNTVYEIAHYLPLLERKRRALKNARPFKQLKIYRQMMDLLPRLPGREKDMLKILKLVVDFGELTVLKAVKECWEEHQISVELIKSKLKMNSAVDSPDFKDIPINEVDLSDYDNLLKGECA